MPDAPQNKPPEKPGLNPAPQNTPNWKALLWYLPFVLLSLWIWQDVLFHATVRTIPYSEFKQYVARREVTKCEIKDNEIAGLIVIQPESPSPAFATSSETSNANEAETSKSEVVPEKPAVAPPPSTPSTVTPTPPEQAKNAEPPKTAEQSKPSVLKQAESAKKKSPEEFIFRTIRVEDPKLVEDLEAAGVEFVGVRPGFLSQFLLSWILPLGLMFLLWSFLSRRLGMAGQAALSIGKSKAKLVADSDTGVTFADVAGCDEAKLELEEVVDFLQKPDRYVKLGAKIPKGVLLVGPPGTGKTLLARAVAGEAKVPFFSLSGSDFVEMFVGVGAARVRDLFDQAEKNAPCIVFIDELDAIGRQRGVHIGSVNDEREQTLNQLLVEMDGFESNAGVILLSATNRPDVLDRALLRPGRFDRQVVVDAPDIGGREAILKIHARNKPLAADADLRKVARATPGFSGADLANVMNEAALLAARRHVDRISQWELDEAVEKVIAGPERKSRLLSDEEKERVAFHEVGHALVGTFSEHADPVHKISIVPRGRAALGFTLQLPTGEQFLMTRSELFDRIKGLLGGRAAEDIVYGEISTGAENDLERATNLAREMVCAYGMSDKIGLVHCANREPVFMPDFRADGQLDCSAETAHIVDGEVKQLLDSAYQAAKSILNEHRQQLDRVAHELLRKETLDAAEFQALLKSENATALNK
jgi:cell division protease FtsH